MNSMYKELSDKAFEYHNNKEYDKAETIYIKLLEIRPEDVNVLNLYGLLCLTKNNFKKAITLLSKAAILKKSSYVISNLAKAYYMDNQAAKAVNLYLQALNYGENDDIYFSLGLAYKRLNNYDEMIKSYQKALKINSKNYKAIYNLALGYKLINDIDNAVLYGELCLKLRNDDYEAYAFLSTCYEERGYINLAVKALEKAIELRDDYYLYYYNLGVLYSKEGNNEKAIELYNKSLELNDNNFETYVNLGYIYRESDKSTANEYFVKAYKIKPDNLNVCLALAQSYRDLYNNQESIDILMQVVIDYPQNSEIYCLLAINYMDLFEYNKAYNYYEKALKYAPDNINYLHGKAVCLKYLGDNETAKKILENIVKEDSNQIQSTITLGMMYLQEKNFEDGYKLYIKRSNNTKFSKLFKDKILTKGTDYIGKNILVYSDCGLGDTIMYSRYLNLLKSKADNVTLQTDKDLIKIFKENFTNINVISKSKKIEEYDYVLPIMNLAYILDSDFNSIPNSSGYIEADKNLTEEYKKLEIFNTSKKKAGLFWRGNKKIFKNRGIEEKELDELLQVNNVQFYSFQIDDTKLEGVSELKPWINDYNDTASLLMNMDILITVDSSIAHMAGALGVKTLLLLPKVSEWRWFNDDKKTSWYDSIDIIKQTETAEWNSVILRVKEVLENL